MPDDSNNNQSNNQNNNQQNNQTGASSGAYGSGKKVCLGADSGCTQEHCSAIQKGLESCGCTVTFTTIDPNQESHMQGKGADFNVFFCNGVAPATMWSFRDAIKSGSLPFTIFAFLCCEPYHNPNEPNGALASLETIRNVAFEPEHDADQFMTGSSSASMATEKSGGGTLGEWIDQNSQYVGLCAGKSPEELTQNICSGACGGGGSAGGGNSGGGAQIKDKTFEKCLRRVCAATDSIFIVESNAAVLFPYVDWMAFTLRQKINTIKSSEIDPNVFSMEYGNDGFYNKVTIAWGGATLPERFPKNEDGTPKDIEKVTNYTADDILKNMRLTNFNYEDFKEQQDLLRKQKEEVKKAKEARRNKNKSTTTNNNNTSTQKVEDIVNKKGDTTQKITVDDKGVTLLSEQYDSLVEKYGEQEKRLESAAPDYETAQYIINALLIQYIRDYNNMCKCRALSDRKYIGGTFYAIENPFTKESELFYLNGYTLRIQKHEPMYHDLDFRYGPEGAEEILDYQTLSGGAAAGGGTTGNSSSEDAIWKDAAKCKWAQDQPDCSTQDPATAKKHYDDYAGKGQEVHFDCYGMSAYLYYRFNNEANIPCQVVGDSSHHVVMLDRGHGFESTRDQYRSYNLDYLFKWREDQNTAVVLAAPNGRGSQSSGNTNSSNTNSGNRG